MFTTYEGNTTISWASIKNLVRNPATDEYATGITGGNGLGGMAVDENGYGWAWGVNNDGQLGIGNTINQDEPAQMLCAEISESIYLEKTSKKSCSL